MNSYTTFINKLRKVLVFTLDGKHYWAVMDREPAMRSYASTLALMAAQFKAGVDAIIQAWRDSERKHCSKKKIKLRKMVLRTISVRTVTGREKTIFADYINLESDIQIAEEFDISVSAVDESYQKLSPITKPIVDKFLYESHQFAKILQVHGFF